MCIVVPLFAAFETIFKPLTTPHTARPIYTSNIGSELFQRELPVDSLIIPAPLPVDQLASSGLRVGFLSPSIIVAASALSQTQ
ncbi:hypothetical protein VTN49DRAFT_2105 [Thermomyces lanuginosus]|uniref:uncharacterized protein n=1 Tax=Thermomyces lanuginosus TaxID=5541 RepID=UPI00374323E2